MILRAREDGMVSSRKWMGYHPLQPAGDAKNL